MCSGSTHDRETLRFCVDILSERESADPGRAWLWKIKKKVALYQIGLQSEAESEAERDLSDSDKAAIRRFHPLLRNTKIRARKRADRGDAAWFRRVRERVMRCFGIR